MYQVVQGLLWIGNALDARNPRALFDAEIAAIVDIAYEELPAQLPRDIVYCRFPLLDGTGNDPRLLQLAIETVVRLLAARIPTIVCCSGGMSRSPAIAAVALSRTRNQPAEEIFNSIVDSHPHDLSAPFWDDVVRACGRETN
jgi:protein-tyrosine phosphatase